MEQQTYIFFFNISLGHKKKESEGVKEPKKFKSSVQSIEIIMRGSKIMEECSLVPWNKES